MVSNTITSYQYHSEKHGNGKEKIDEIDRLKVEVEADQKTMNDGVKNLISKAKDLGYDETGLVELVGSLWSEGTSRRTSKPQNAAPESADSSGAMPEKGVTYKHASFKEWTAQGKRTPGTVLEVIRSGKTWAELRSKK